MMSEKQYQDATTFQKMKFGAYAIGAVIIGMLIMWGVMKIANKLDRKEIMKKGNAEAQIEAEKRNWAMAKAFEQDAELINRHLQEQLNRSFDEGQPSDEFIQDTITDFPCAYSSRVSKPCTVDGIRLQD